MIDVLIYLASPHRVWSLDERYPRLLAEKFPQVRVISARSKEESLEHLAGSEVLYTWSLPERHFAAALRLRWLHTPSAGVDEVLHPALVRSGVRVTCSRGVSSAALADHAMGMILAFSRGLAVALREAGSGAWNRERYFQGNPMPVELDGRTLGILGYGSIGEELARRARGFGMKIHALRRNRTGGEGLCDRLFGPSHRREFLASADVLVIALPLTPQTAGMLDDEALAGMKPGALLINIARGGLIREDALVRALESGRIAAAGLDVFAEEPLPATSPLHRLPNVLLTPHIGGLHPHYLDRATSIFIVNLGRYLRGESLLHEVDKHAGY
ncbi:MAG TPA: D-2-hydroxyacid dehydrogenase [Candidatus Polarisedimenticolia bacterium]|jgi:phosphoglycerate dehydrogenase-like enzyme|nr:D-2-hydroxyacid dehydrogenase [Candidatus Polarisedimenticolia bacterium]